MEIEEYKQRTARGEYIGGDGEVRAFMHRMAAQAQRVTAKINSGYHTPEELRALFSELTGQAVDESFSLFPPLYSDFGRNITVGRNVIIN